MRGFFFSWSHDRAIRATDDRDEVAARLGGRARLRDPESGARAERGDRHWYLLEMLPYPRARHAHGARPELHDGGRRHPLPPPQRLDACCARWAGTRSACPRRTPRSARAAIRARSPSATSRRSAPDAADGLGDRLVARGLHAPAGLLPLDAVAVPALLRARPRLPQGGAGQLVPERPDRARERVGRRRPLRALRRRGREAEHDAVVLPDHGLRGRAARRTTLLEGGEWPERMKTMQRNWIGR